MEKYSVTLKNAAGYLVGGTLVAVSAACGLAAVFSATADWVLSAVIAGGCLALAVFFFYKAATEITLDETGIYIKTPFTKKHYSWTSVKQVSVARVARNDSPHYYLKTEKRKIEIDYTKRTQLCILQYYGQPDCDKWGKPPQLL